MAELALRIRFIDAIRADRAMPMIILLAMALAIYLGVSLKSALLQGLPATVVIWLGVIFVETKASYFTLTKGGITFRNRCLKPVSRTWKDAIRVGEKKTPKYQCHEIIDTTSGESAGVPKVIFTYSEVIPFVTKNVPPEHAIRKLIENQL